MASQHHFIAMKSFFLALLILAIGFSCSPDAKSNIAAAAKSAFRSTDGVMLNTTMEKMIRSTDKGKTWELMVPSVAGKVFSLYGSDGLIYAVTSKPGC